MRDGLGDGYVYDGKGGSGEVGFGGRRGMPRTICFWQAEARREGQAPPYRGLWVSFRLDAYEGLSWENLAIPGALPPYTETVLVAFGGL